MISINRSRSKWLSFADKKIVKMLKQTFFLVTLLFVTAAAQIEGQDLAELLIDHTIFTMEQVQMCPESDQSFDNICRKYSCEGVCGHQHDLCSCDELCTQVGDCCFDFDVACPALAEEGQQKFHRFGRIDYNCDDNRNMIVASCPSYDMTSPTIRDGGNYTEMSANETQNNGTQQESQPNQEKIPFKPRLDSRLVVDTRKGLLFANRSIFFCNGNNIRYMKLYRTKGSISNGRTVSSEGRKLLRACSNLGVFSCPRIYLEQTTSCLFDGIFNVTTACIFLEQKNKKFPKLTVHPVNTSRMSEMLSNNRTVQAVVNPDLEEAHKNVACRAWSFDNRPRAFFLNVTVTDAKSYSYNKSFKSEYCQTETNYLNKSCFPHTATVSYGTTNFENDCDFINFRNEILKIVADTMIYWRLSFESHNPENKEIYSMEFFLTKGDYTNSSAFLFEWGFWSRQQLMMHDRFYSGYPVPDEINLCVKYELTTVICYQLYYRSDLVPNKSTSDSHLDLNTNQPCQEEDIYKSLKETFETLNPNERKSKGKRNVTSNNLGDVIHSDSTLWLIFIGLNLGRTMT